MPRSQSVPFVSFFPTASHYATTRTPQPITDVREKKPSSPGRPTDVYHTQLPHSSEDVQRYIKNNVSSLLTPAQEVSKLIARALHKKFGMTINPDTTYIVTTNYDLSKGKPRDGKMLNSISLTDAALTNMRTLNTDDNTLSSAQKTNKKVLDIIGKFSVVGGLLNLFRAPSPPSLPNPDNMFEYVVGSIANQKTPSPDLSSKLPFAPQAFRDLVWNTELAAPYKKYLDSFWRSHETTYQQLSKIAFAQAAHTQAQEGSLSEQDAHLAMRAAGLAPGKPWLETSMKNLEATYAKDPKLEIGLLSVNGDKSTDLMYVIDKTVRQDANGKDIKATLLHIPGNASPIHRFDSPEEMKTWVADQAADPKKRAALRAHFKKSDQDDKYFSDGVDQSLKGLGGWTEAHKPDPLGFTSPNGWDPQRYITLEPIEGCPFNTITLNQKERSYADANHDITTDSDVNKATLLRVTEAATATALMLTPLAFLMPEIGLALDVLYAGAGLMETGIGIDDLAHGKSAGTDRIVFGLLNAAPGIAGGASRLGKGAETVEIAFADNVAEPTSDSIMPLAEEHTPWETFNRLRPQASGNISAYAVTDGERLIDGIPRNANHIYQVPGADGMDRWLIKHTDHSAIVHIYEIKSTFKLSDGYVEIIDPASRQSVMTVHLNTAGEWVRFEGAGGMKFPWQRSQPSAKAQLNEAIANINRDSSSFSEAETTQIQDDLSNLIRASKAELSESLNEYTEAGSDEINSELRRQPDERQYSEQLQAFLADFDSQADYTGKAYRYAYVTADGEAALKNGVGKVFRDAAVQSASTQAFNAKSWGAWAKNASGASNNKPVVYVFDESVPKKNLSSSFLFDHVAVEPEASLEVKATKTQDGVLYVYLESPAKMPDQRYNLFDGSVARPY